MSQMDKQNCNDYDVHQLHWHKSYGLTKSMTMSTHRRHHGPLFLLWIKTLDSVQSLEPITASNDKEETIDHTDAKL